MNKVVRRVAGRKAAVVKSHLDFSRMWAREPWVAGAEIDSTDEERMRRDGVQKGFSSSSTCIVIGVAVLGAVVVADVLGGSSSSSSLAPLDSLFVCAGENSDTPFVGLIIGKKVRKPLAENR